MKALSRDVARVTVELKSPLHIGTGSGDELCDSLLVTDANGLPCMPGTSLAGALRSKWEQEFGGEKAAAVFGSQEDGLESRSGLEVSFGHVHDSRDRPVPPRMQLADIMADPLLRAIRQPLVRQHVRLTHRHVAAQRGLYDENVVPAGNRFTFELCAVGMESGVLDNIIAWLASGSVRLGAKTRSGLGNLKLVRVWRRRFDLGDDGDYRDYCSLPVGLHEEVEGILPAVEIEGVEHRQEQVRAVKIRIVPTGFWMVGGGQPGKAEEKLDEKNDKAPDIVPYREGRVRWKVREDQSVRGELDLEGEVVVPGSAIKGALRHRTAFHYNRLQGTFADNMNDEKELEKHDGLNCPACQELFGAVLHHDQGGSAGRVFVEDVFAGYPDQQRIMHVSLDRFTCGPIDGALFEDAPCFKGRPWEFTITIADAAGVSREARKALDLALRDLVEERLSIGRGSGPGYGFCAGEYAWDDDGQWVNEGVER